MEGMTAKLGLLKNTGISIYEPIQAILVAIVNNFTMRKIFSKKISWLPFIVGFLLVFTLEACYTQKQPPRRRNGKIPKSGRIPCPIKDC
jgi:hypothetical protein